MQLELLVDITGWLGAAAVLYAYFLVSTGRLSGNSVHYQFFNVLGAVCLVFNTFFNHAYPSMVVNIIWILVAIYSLIRKVPQEKTAAPQQKLARVKVRKPRRLRKPF